MGLHVYSNHDAGKTHTSERKQPDMAKKVKPNKNHGFQRIPRFLGIP